MESLKGITLDKILSAVYNDYQLVSYLSRYISYRKTQRQSDDIANDFVGSREVNEDTLYSIDF